MERTGLPRLSRRLGQHLVVDEGVLRRMVDYAEVGPDDVVLEIGTGTGNLTRLLAGRAARVYTIEKDRRLLEIARGSVTAGDVRFIHGDARKVELPEFTKVVANIPYQISSEITFRLLERSFRLGGLMDQLAVASSSRGA